MPAYAKDGNVVSFNDDNASRTAHASGLILGGGWRSLGPSYVTPGICSSEIARLPVVGS